MMHGGVIDADTDVTDVKDRTQCTRRTRLTCNGVHLFLTGRLIILDRSRNIKNVDQWAEEWPLRLVCG